MTPDLQPAVLATELDRLAQVDRLLVATDYDGVIAPIVSDPAAAFPLPGSMHALRVLSGRAGVTVALISGRDRETLHRLSGAAAPLITVGSHGAEWSDDLLSTLDGAALARRTELIAELTAIADRYPGAQVELKPLGAALHVREVVAGRPAAEAALTQARGGPATIPGVYSTVGKAVLELAIRDTSKGLAVQTLRERTGADAVLYFGDDVTDEKAFAVLGGRDVGVKVGPGPTAARNRVSDPAAVRSALEYLAARR
jgi:trehalose 6-phosphate phosphatase